MSDLRDEVQAGFQQRFDEAPDGVWSAPGRVNLIGEHTDYNDGFVLPFAINRRTLAALRLRDDRRIRLATSFADDTVEIELDTLAPKTIDGWAAYPLGVAWALGQGNADLGAVPGFDLYLDSDVPVGAGLSSSAAIECAVAVALNDVWRLGLDRRALVDAGHRAENDFVGAPTGILDQSASLLGQADSALFIDCRNFDTEVIPLGLEAAGLDVLVIDTRVNHAHADGGYASRRASCEAGAAALGVASLRELTKDDLLRARDTLDGETYRRVRHVVTENDRVLETVRLLRTEGPAAIGDLLDASHRSLRNDFEVSVPELDLAVETAQNYGALGARMTGGGFGGSAIALVPRHLISHVKVAVDGAFAEHGYAHPDMFTVVADEGARRDV
ncbi:galactokinase [Microbacterium sp. STN6]|uniref:galactokinase n=1 Tax=Microbacterium sp. STN6 TaxID=2995588 RepID=UPI002260A541|nr:galactokinase [Microbacterium sp. STN6]MCX7523363.1 galactokinase [Microbacterium sp. STN6]